jgi:hypothetical protein
VGQSKPSAYRWLRLSVIHAQSKQNVWLTQCYDTIIILFRVELHLKSVGIPLIKPSIQRRRKVPEEIDIQQIIADINKTLDELQDEVIKMQIDLHAYRLERAILKESK